MCCKGGTYVWGGVWGVHSITHNAHSAQHFCAKSHQLCSNCAKWPKGWPYPCGHLQHYAVYSVLLCVYYVYYVCNMLGLLYLCVGCV